jgi:sugar phosphate isomerase/epimerase
MRLGIGSYTYTWAAGVPGSPPARPLTALGLLEKAARLGVRVVQFCDNLSLARLPGDELDGCLAFARAKGIAVQVGTRGLDPDDIIAHLGIALRAGSSFVRLVVDGGWRRPTPAEAVSALRQVLPTFEKSRARIAIENHDRFPVRTLAAMVEELGPDRAGICLDTVNSLGALEGPRAVVETLAPYTLNLHLKDFVIERVPSKMGFVVEGRPVGSGRLDVPWLLGALRAAGRDVDAIIELWTPPAGSIEETLGREEEWAAESVRYLREIIRE